MTEGISASTGAAASARVVARMLSERFGAPVRVGEPVPVRDPKRPIVLVPIVEGPASVPSRVVAKWFADKPYLSPRIRLANEASALALLGALHPEDRLVPRLYAVDACEGVVVMEHLEGAVHLGDALHQHDPHEARSALLRMANALGAMHRRTAPLESQHEKLRSQWARSYRYRHEGYLALYKHILEVTGVRSYPGGVAELRAAIALLDDPAPFGALSHGDLCPDNAVFWRGEVRFLDFEGAMFRNALVDLVAVISGFTGCCSAGAVPGAVEAEIDDAYLKSFSQGRPELGDPVAYGRAKMAAMVTRTLFPWNDALLTADQRWGTCSQRQRVVARFRRFAGLSAVHGAMTSVGITLAAVADALCERWGEQPALPAFPAFREG